MQKLMKRVKENLGSVIGNEGLSVNRDDDFIRVSSFNYVSVNHIRDQTDVNREVHETESDRNLSIPSALPANE